MKELRSLVIVLFGLCVTITISVLVSIYGWGLTPHNWWWIIGMGVVGNMFARLILYIAETGKDK